MTTPDSIKDLGTRTDYSRISNLEQLREARIRLRNRIELKEMELSLRTQSAKQALNPLTYVHRIVTKLYSMDYLIRYFHKGFNFARSIVEQWKAGREDGNLRNENTEIPENGPADNGGRTRTEFQ